MITSTQRKELEKIKPPKYREKVKDFLVQNGYDFSLETIQKVYSGKRNNLIIAKAIITVFSNYMNEKNDINNKLDEIIETGIGVRAFIRPSGTEDVVRIYVEGPDIDQVIQINDKIQSLFKNDNI